jgi:hypothetical protein
VTFTCNRLDRTQQRDKPLSAADGHTTIYEMLGGKYRDNAVDAAYDSFETFPSYLQVSLGVARDLSDQPGYVTRVLDEPLEIDPQTALPDVSFRLFHFDPTFAPKGKTAVTCFLPTHNFSYWAGLVRLMSLLRSTQRCKQEHLAESADSVV